LEKEDNRFKFLFDTLWLTAIQANNDFFNVHITKLDYVQLAEYSAEYKGEYKDHHDVFWINNDPIYHRKLSCIIQLTDPNEYEGGEFELIDTNQFPNANDIKQQGTIIYFPSFFLHRAKPVTKGVRYSIAAWFDGPKWR
jgi:PKHD-type hydroxylase